MGEAGMALAESIQESKITSKSLDDDSKSNFSDRLKTAVNAGIFAVGTAAFSYALYKTGQGVVDLLHSTPIDVGHGNYYYPNTHQTIHLEAGQSFPQEPVSTVSMLKYGGAWALAGSALFYCGSVPTSAEVD